MQIAIWPLTRHLTPSCGKIIQIYGSGPRDKLGPYEIMAPIGAGGMGEVFRARDTMLKREVALKVLPAAFVQDPERMARFQRERKCWPRSTIRTLDRSMDWWNPMARAPWCSR